jgi:hypothetical protein
MSETITERKLSPALIKQIARKIFVEDWLVKLVALGVTFALWLGVTGLSEPTDRRLNGIPLTLQFSSEMEVTNSPVQDVTVIITGDKRLVSPINGNDLIVSVDLTGIPAGERVIQLLPENVRIDLPTGVKVKEIQPSRIAVNLEAVEQKEITVQVETTGDPEDGFEVYGRAVVPARVRVRGPASYIRSLSMVSTEKIDISGLSKDLAVKQVPLVLASADKVALLDAYVDVNIRIGEKRMERIFSLPAPEGRTAIAVLYGPRSLLMGISAADLSVESVTNEAGFPSLKLNMPESFQGRVEIRKLESSR